MKAKKIGILTFQDTLNYGASMQCFALQKKMQLLGADAEVIDYKCPKLKKEYSPFFISEPTLRKVLYMLAALKMNFAKQKKKAQFQKQNIRVSREYTQETILQANDVYDTFVVGSDQVWNWHLTDFDKTFFLDFVRAGKEKASYAASFGISEIDAEKVADYQKLLRGYTEISVRETSGAELTEKLIGTKPVIVADPVLLLSADEWAKVAAKPSLQNYVLLYSINDTEAYSYAAQAARQTGKTLVYLSAPLKKHGDFVKVTDLGPDEFVGWFEAADYVVTDSFHGVVTSILFRKQFVALQDRRSTANANSRVWDLLQKLSLTDRIVKSASEIAVLLQEIHYEQVQPKLEAYIDDSVRYLKHIIDGE